MAGYDADLVSVTVVSTFRLRENDDQYWIRWGFSFDRVDKRHSCTLVAKLGVGAERVAPSRNGQGSGYHPRKILGVL